MKKHRKKHRFEKDDLVVIAVKGLDIPKGTLCYIDEVDENDEEQPYRVIKDGINFDGRLISLSIHDWEWCSENDLEEY